MLKPIVTLTLNPCIDASCQADQVQPLHKIRTDSERYDPAGGGIYLAGGTTGQIFGQMIRDMGLDAHQIPIAGDTRISHLVYERATGLEYRFVPEGPHIEDHEWRSCLELMGEVDADYSVGSGSLPPGIPDDFYARIARMAKRNGAKFALAVAAGSAAVLTMGTRLCRKPDVERCRRGVTRLSGLQR